MDIKTPINEEAERVLLGRMMNSYNIANIIFEKMEESDFFDASNRAIFSCGYKLFLKDRTIDATSILAQMEEDFPSLANYSTIHGMASYFSGINVSIDQFIEIVKKYSISRKIINFSKEMMIESASLTHSTDEIKNKFLSESDEIFKGVSQGKTHTFSEVVHGDFKETGKNFFEYLEWKKEQFDAGKSTIEGYLTGYPLLDDCLEGFNRKHYIIIGARAGVGKTTFILNLMKRFMQRKLKVGFFSLEMPKEMVVEKFLSMESEVDLKNFNRGNLSPNEIKSVFEAAKKIDTSMVINDESNLYVSQLTACAKRWVKSEGVQVIFIDYLSEVRGDGRYLNKQEEIQYVSKSLRAIAKNLNVPVICLAQLNRENEKGDRRPRKSDLRESGQIEADAYSILLLHRNDTERPRVLEVHVVKNRLGSEKSFDFDFHMERGVIHEIGYYKMKDPQKEEEIKKSFGSWNPDN